MAAGDPFVCMDCDASLIAKGYDRPVENTKNEDGSMSRSPGNTKDCLCEACYVKAYKGAYPDVAAPEVRKVTA